MNQKQKKEQALRVIERLKGVYPDAVCSLTYQKPYELLFAVRLSAQCTDARVNQVTPALFAAFPTLEAFASAETEAVEKYIFSCGLYHSKAVSLIACAKMLLEEYDGQVPDSMEQLLKLPGVGRKTANLIMGDVFGRPAIVTDTHCIRITNRLGLAKGKEPAKVEQQLWKVIPPEEGNGLCHRFVLFGRDTCTARSPKCGACPLSDICPSVIQK